MDKNRILSLLLVLILVVSALPVCAFAADITWEEAYTLTGEHLERQTHTIGADWIIIGLSRSGREASADYCVLLTANIRETTDENNCLHRSKATENARTILTLTAMGQDATDVDGVDLVAGLNSMDYVKKQGLTGVIWTLLALDCGNYAACGDVSREALVQILLGAECAGGGWAASGSYADPDMTAMALQALAPYRGKDPEVKASVERAVAVLSGMQREDGGFASAGVAVSESVSQVIVALTALGIDPGTDKRFVKNGVSAVDALAAYCVAGGGFRHTPDGDRDGIATEQGYYALAAYHRFLAGENTLYDMTDILDKGGDMQLPAEPDGMEPITEPEKDFPWWAVIAGGAVCAAAIVMLRKKKQDRPF